MFFLFLCWVSFMILEYQLNKASVAFNEIYYDSPRVEIFLWVHFLEACVVLNIGNLNLIYFSRFSPIIILGDVIENSKDVCGVLLWETVTLFVCKNSGIYFQEEKHKLEIQFIDPIWKKAFYAHIYLIQR